MSELSLADRAADYLLRFGQKDESNRAIASLFFETANEVAQAAGVSDFVDLAFCGTAEQIAGAIEKSLKLYGDALSTNKLNIAGASAAVHLLNLDLIRELDSAPEAKQIARLAAHLYAQENAYRTMMYSKLNANA